MFFVNLTPICAQKRDKHQYSELEQTEHSTSVPVVPIRHKNYIESVFS